MRIFKFLHLLAKLLLDQLNHLFVERAGMAYGDGIGRIVLHHRMRTSLRVLHIFFPSFHYGFLFDIRTKGNVQILFLLFFFR